MNKLSILLSFLLFAFISTASAATITCTVNTVEEGQVTLTCGEEAVKLEPGTKVKVRPKAKRKAVEGC